MNNIVWKNAENKHIVTVIADVNKDPLELKDEMLRLQEFNGFEFVGFNYSDNQIKSLTTESILELKNSKIAQCKSYLVKTDWQPIAYQERGREYDDVKTKRLEAVLAQDLIEACTTLEELNQINTDF